MIREDLAAYYTVISHLDAQVGRILDALRRFNLDDRTVVIFTSDHGVAMGSHGLRGKQNMYDHTVGVPLVMRGPGIPRGRATRAQVYLRDLYPTVCQLVGVPVPRGLDGRSFHQALRDPTWAGHEYVFCHFRDVQRMVRSERWKLIFYPHIGRWQLFDLSADPYELNDLSQRPELARQMLQLRAVMRRSQRRFGDPLVGSGSGQQPAPRRR